MFSVVDARALSRAAASDIPEWYITKSDTGGEFLMGTAGRSIDKVRRDFMVFKETEYYDPRSL
jgi:hypothetical protein